MMVQVGTSLKTWEWTRRLVHWIIISAGTMSELVFLIGCLWVSINANVHQFVLLFLSEDITRHITELATTAFVALPECIVGLAVVTTFGHIRLWLYDRKNYKAIIWSVLYGIPAIIFLVLSLITLGFSVASVTFIAPTWMVVIRALAAFMYAFTSLLYTQLGKPQEAERLREKDDFISELITKIGSLSDELEEQKEVLTQTKSQNKRLFEELNKSDEDALQAYSSECIEWLKSGVKTSNIEDINRFTGHSKRKITNAIGDGILQVSTRNKELILVSSLVEWLKNNPPKERDTGPMLRIMKQ